MKAQIQDLIKIQQEVNAKIREKTTELITNEQFILAFNIELFEYFNAVGLWKWWKHSHKVDRVKVLDELADCFAFFLSLVDNQNEFVKFEGEEEIIEKVENEINFYLDALEKHAFETNFTKEEILIDLITYVGTDNESQGVYTTERFAIAIFIATILFENITWEELVAAYKEKSKINIQRQVENY